MTGIRQPARPVVPSAPLAGTPPAPPVTAPSPPTDRPAGPETPRTPEPRPVRTERNRTWALHPDPSGMYEQVIGVELHRGRRPLTLQLHRAGRTVVGWFALPPGEYAKSAAPTSWPPGKRGLTPGPGVFVADARRTRPDGSVDMYWWRTTTAAAGAGNPGDPTDSAGRRPDNESAGFGSIGFETGSHRITVRFDLAGTPDVFTRYSTRLRPPWSAVRHLTGSTFDAAQVHHVAPLAPRWVAAVLDHLAGPRMVDLLIEWHTASTSESLPPSIKREVRKALVGHLTRVGELAPGPLPDHYRVSLQSLVRARLEAVSVTIEDVTRSLWRWLEQAAAEIEPGTVEAVWQRLGIETAGAEGFAYIVDFEMLSPVELLKLAGAKLKEHDIILGLKGSLAVFLLSVRRLAVRFVLDKSGARTRDDDGNPVVADPAALSRAQQEGENDLIAPLQPRWSTRVDGPGTSIVGVFADLGAGLGRDIAVERDPAGGLRTTTTVQQGGSAKPGPVTFFSSARVDAADFDAAVYTVVTLKGPGVGFGPIKGLNAPSSSLHVLRLDGGVRLERIVTTEASLRLTPTPPKPQQFLSVEALKKFIAPVFKFRLFELALGVGGTIVLGPATPVPASERKPTFQRNFLVRDDTPHHQWFDRGLSTLRSSPDALRDDRALLEVYLATARGLIRPGMTITVDGCTSPEGTPAVNLRLSSDRARAVADAIEDALPEVPEVLDAGYGEAPSLASGLLDPPEALADQRAWERRHPEQVGQWPRWRRVDVVIDGRTLVEGLWEP